jgi:uncharacterized protein (TIGR04255 family)
MTQGSQYSKPPIDEAVVEFLLEPAVAWDGTVPGRLQVELAGAYSGPPTTQTLFSWSVVPVGVGALAPPQRLFPQAMARTVLPNQDGTRLVGVAPNVLTVHELAPYRGWDEFSRRAREALDARSKPRGAAARRPPLHFTP